MMKRIFIALVLCFSFSIVHSQELEVKNMQADAADLSAVVHQVADLNGDPCALIKIGLTEAGATFEGDVIKVEQKSGEYWVYMIDGANWLVVKTGTYTPLRHEFDAVKKNTTYIMVVGPKDDKRPPILPVKLTPAATIGGKAGKPVEFNLLLVKAGMFEMGATAEQVGADEDENPVHWVKISKDFYMGETEVTQALWEFVMGNNPSTFKDPNKPVEMVSWNDCQEFIRRLNDLTKARFRLPTESEWEYVARGGNKTMRTQYSGSANADEVAWHYANSQNNSHPVKSKKPNELGFYDMSGNVWEHCADYKNEYPRGEVTDPIGSKPDKNRVRRGGGWDCKSVGEVRVAFRRRVEVDMREKSLGLRLVMEIAQ